MASTYVNNLRLNEMATGDASGTWGTTTNTNLELIGEALGFGTEAITTNADTHTTTVADGSSDAGRAMYLKYTGTLDSACTITIAPNTMKRMQFIENGTSGSQNIIISQGSGANITIPPGDTKAVYLDGAGSGAAVVDAFASLNVVDLKVQDDLTVTDDLIVNGDIDLEGSIDVNGTANLDNTDIDGTLDVSGQATFADGSAGAPSISNTGDVNAGLFFSAADVMSFSAGGTAQFTMADGAISPVTDSDVDLGTSSLYYKDAYIDTITTTGNIAIGGDVTTADFDVDASGDINLDAGGGDWRLKDDGSTICTISNVSGDLQLLLGTQDKDFKFQVNDGGSQLDALVLDASLSGQAIALKSARIGQAALTSSSNAVTWDAAAAANAYHVTTENTTFSAPSNAIEGAIISVEIAQGSTARTIGWNTVFEFAASTAPTVTATANKTDIFSFRYNGSVWQEIGRVQNLAQT